MSTILTIILFTVYCAGFNSSTLTDPWGSRIVTQKTGEATLNFKYAKGHGAALKTFDVITNSGSSTSVKIAECSQQDYNDPTSLIKSCKSNIKADTFTVTVNSVTAQKGVRLTYDSSSSMYAFFTPDCKFADPAADTVVLKESIPLSRFVKGPTTLPLTFAVMGTSSKAVLKRDGHLLCEWTGVTLRTDSTIDAAECRTNKGSTGTDLELNAAQTMRVATTTIIVGVNAINFYEWGTPETTPHPTSFSITIDGSKAAESSEMTGCSITETTSTASVTETTSTASVTETTSTASARYVEQILEANVGLLCALLYLRKW